MDDSSTLTLGEAISTRGMIRHWKETGGTSVSANSTLSDLITAADSNDEKAQATLAKAGHYLGKAVAIECVLMDPQRVRIQGEFVRARHWFESSFCKHCKRKPTIAENYLSQFYLNKCHLILL